MLLKSPMPKGLRSDVARRDVLGGLALAGLSSTGLALPASANRGETTVLGDFEDGTEGWTTDGGNSLSTVSRSEQRLGVTHGSRALEVHVNGDGFPAIHNRRAIGRADLVEYPYLIADVTPGTDANVDSALSFQFRLHHSHGGDETGGNGKRGSTSNEKPALVEASREVTAGAPFTDSLTWDLTELDEEVRRKAKRLEIRWHPLRYPPEGGARGNQRNVDYRGSVYVDWVRLSDNPTDVAARQYHQRWQSLEAEHGRYVDTEIEERTDDGESGAFVFEDGTRVAYELVVLGEHKYRLTVDSESFQLGTGWE